ncbi:DNA translocase FtsK [Bacillus sp. Bva_UNVM-123]|uniref:DNA translocase FtsK n=1 Tax=Bacillus sp. Bva_UNVM-123 TaxID=2829798 RepID=UPI00391EE5C5
MSWIKKIVRIFKNDEENNEEYKETIQPEWKDSQENQAKASKDVNARVFYQYPKGQFRFPLIPDDNSEPKMRKERPYQAKKMDPQAREVKKKVEEQKQIHKQQQRSKSNTSQIRTKVEPVRKHGPFRPTEIPSPIYGFKRPSPKVAESTKKEQIIPIEYELNSHASEEIEDSLLELSPTPINEEYRNDSEFRHIILEDSHMDSTEVHLEQLSSCDEMDEVEVAQDVSKELEPIEKEYDEHAGEQFVQEEELEEIYVQEEELAEVYVQEKELAEVYIQEEELEEVYVQEDELEEIYLQEKELEEVYVQEKELEESNLEPEHEEYTNVDEIEESVQNPDPAPRKHIPFNVLMLNQDKQKLYKGLSPASERSINNSQPIQEIELNKQTEEEEEIEEVEPISYYQFPSSDLLTLAAMQEDTSDWLIEQEQLLNSTLLNFNVGAKVVNVTQGPSVTRYEVQPDPGVKVNKITNLSDDIKLSLAARDIRIEAPIPGKHTIGIEVPNKTSRPVFIREIVESDEFITSSSPLTAILGLDIAGNPIVTDLRKMPHGLIAGATGSGKSVCINSILVSLLYKANPDELKLILIDPKMVELAPYNGIPHLVSPVITDVKAATAALKWAVDEMERRYELFAHTGVREIRRFNDLAEEHKRYSEKLPYIVIIIDELADLMMMSPADVEEAICRIAQKARACGIHLIIATQRPSVDVITGLIKANVPTRIAFSVSSQIDSRTIIDISGAEKLLGRGDMLFLENGSSKPVRLQGTFVSDDEIDDVVAHVKREREPEYLFEQEELLKKAQVIEEEDELFYEACEFVVEQGAASTSSLQRRFKIGYNRAARLIDMMEQQGFISEGRGSKPREVHLTEDELESLQDTSTLN